MKYIFKTAAVCAVAEFLNFLSVFIFYETLHLPLFMDTIFTVAVVFYAGLVPGLIVAAGYNIFDSFIAVLYGYPFSAFTMLFSLCGISIAFITWLFARNKSEFKISPAITFLYLLLIVFITSFCSVFISGIIDYYKYTHFNLPDMVAPVKNFTMSFLSQKFSLFASCILGQVPVSFSDRLITTFAGFGVYKLAVRFFGEINN
ncbi:ABC-type multidrug transport system fused ATPase/permease subunit [Treponema rectale]|uniref:ABC-type multidrug transport system fused ATPase/permease subunit n=1 Tax=Treponema rectale TaxID=744512 RepID=A0A840SFQ4_9SPIR|nr:hypothetical protein [Treponema rectale]MBB5219570.1 ABC-type multidrug transport system fused ATPase/permease subunit [Treponema rectale]